eukprot:scaffold149779_cov36-Tisochrysis_lutea.AAC.3
MAYREGWADSDSAPGAVHRPARRRVGCCVHPSPARGRAWLFHRRMLAQVICYDVVPHEEDHRSLFSYRLQSPIRSSSASKLEATSQASVGYAGPQRRGDNGRCRVRARAIPAKGGSGWSGRIRGLPCGQGSCVLCAVCTRFEVLGVLRE